jgi:hypothetical protein
MPRSKTAWKALEKQVAKALKGIRVLRGADFSKTDVDVKVPDFPNLQIDAKYRTSWAHHSYLEEVRAKYCNDPVDMPILVTKTHGQRGAVVVMDLEHFGLLLESIRELRSGR